MSGLVEKLRARRIDGLPIQFGRAYEQVVDPLAIEAADRITALEAENAALREALEPFAKAADDAERLAGHDGPPGAYVDYADLCTARAAPTEEPRP